MLKVELEEKGYRRIGRAKVKVKGRWYTVARNYSLVKWWEENYSNLELTPELLRRYKLAVRKLRNYPFLLRLHSGSFREIVERLEEKARERELEKIAEIL